MGEQVFAELKQQPLSLTVLEHFRDAIISGRLKPGASLNQSQLAVQFGVSRAPVREAMNKLEEEGLIVSVPYKGAIVAPLRRKDIEELRSLRLVLERFAAELMLANLTDDGLAEIEAIYDRMLKAADEGDTTTLDLEDLAIHTKVCELSGHALLYEVWQLYATRFRRVLALRNEIKRNPHALVEMHIPLLEALRSRDRAALMAFYEDHGTDTTTVLTTTWPESFPDDED